MNARTKSESPQASGTQLNKFLANAGVASRRQCAILIKEGQVKVNGMVVTEPGYRVREKDVVKHKGKAVEGERKVYILLNKPRNCITTVSDERDRNTVMDLLKGVKERVFPVGRLDRNTTGLLLLTNDGELAQRLSHPSGGAKKLYKVTLDRPLPLDVMKEIATGIHLEDGLAAIDEIAYADVNDNSVIGIELHTGRNRIVRRIFEYLHYRVEKLDRVMYAGLTKKDLQRGKWRYLSSFEINQLRRVAGTAVIP